MSPNKNFSESSSLSANFENVDGQDGLINYLLNLFKDWHVFPANEKVSFSEFMVVVTSKLMTFRFTTLIMFDICDDAFKSMITDATWIFWSSCTWLSTVWWKLDKLTKIYLLVRLGTRKWQLEGILVFAIFWSMMSAFNNFFQKI